jgi:signal transduction histidine kinase
MARASIADLVVELGDLPDPGRLRDGLAAALRDDTLEVGYWSPASGTYLDGDGAIVRLPAEGARRAATRLDHGASPVAVIIHDASIADDPGLVAAVAAATRLIVENSRLTSTVEEQLAEVSASRARIVEAGDAERRRVERDLHDGAQQQLVTVSLALRLARMRMGDAADPEILTSLDEAAAAAKSALAELRALARGIYPAVLTEAGLGAAIRSLADRSAVPADVTGATTERFSPVVERTAYFVVSEALTNVNKYANATLAHVTIERGPEELTVEVSDDGIGDADPARGSGLNGLVDRLAAIDGSLHVVSPRGAGTTLKATIPLA